MARSLAVLALTALCWAASIASVVAAGAADNIPSWHPHRLKRQRQELHAEKITSTFECGTFENSKWKRKFCFGALHIVQENIGVEKLTEVKMNLTITKQMKKGGEGAQWANTCKDSMRIRFRSLRSVFAPYQEEVECGVHELSFIVPPDAPEYSLDLFLVHIDGEGMADPPYSRLYPENLVNHNDGPAFYNVRVVFEGNQRLRVPKAYLQDEEDDADPWFIRSAEEPIWQNGKRQRANKRPALPECKTGDGPGRWVFHHSIYPDFPGEPIVWRPYNCHFKLISGSTLKECLQRIGKTMTFGESTLNQIHDAMQLHMNLSGYYWPSKIIAPNPTVYKGLHPELYGTEQHGMSVMLAGGVNELLEQNPDALVILQGANDPARDSLENYEKRFREFVGKVKAWKAEGKLKFKKIFLIGAPTRQNKQGGYAGQTVCPEGERETCVVTPSSAFVMPNAQVRWITVQDSVDNIVQFFGTLDRRRVGNKMTRRVMSEAFPNDVIHIDYEALTAALPADYCIDGEHWGCPWHAWMWREKTPYLCKSLGNLAAANILSNLLCQMPGGGK